MHLFALRFWDDGGFFVFDMLTLLLNVMFVLALGRCFANLFFVSFRKISQTFLVS